MSHEEIRKIANGNANEKVKSNGVSKEEKQVEKVLDISNDFIYEFCKSASKEDREWVKQHIAQCILDYGEDKYFPKFRSEFAKKFYPDLLAKKKKKPTLLERIKMLDD